MGNALKGTPAAWVHFDKNAKAPTSRNQTVTIGEPVREDRSSPPLARPLYRPAPVAPVRTPERDFDDLPGEEIPTPDHTDSSNTQKQNNKPDALERLIDVFQ